MSLRNQIPVACDEDFSATSVRPAYSGTNRAMVKVATKWTVRILERRRVRAGWVSCRIKKHDAPKHCIFSGLVTIWRPSVGDRTGGRLVADVERRVILWPHARMRNGVPSATQRSTPLRMTAALGRSQRQRNRLHCMYSGRHLMMTLVEWLLRILAGLLQ